MKVLGQLLTPLDYLRIRADTREKVVVDWVLPVFLAVAATAVWSCWPQLLPVNGQSGLLANVGSFMQVLVGFYVASLAAVATFPGASLDENVNRMTLHSKPIKRRVFLANLFGYLALISLLLFLAMLFKGIPIALVGKASEAVAVPLRLSLYFAYQLVFWQMIMITLLGLHYLTNRIHRSDTGR